MESAWTLQDHHDLSWWDALIVSAAQTAGYRYLLTEDLQDSQLLGMSKSSIHLRPTQINSSDRPC